MYSNLEKSAVLIELIAAVFIVSPLYSIEFSEINSVLLKLATAKESFIVAGLPAVDHSTFSALGNFSVLDKLYPSLPFAIATKTPASFAFWIASSNTGSFATGPDTLPKLIFAPSAPSNTASSSASVYCDVPVSGSYSPKTLKAKIWASGTIPITAKGSSGSPLPAIVPAICCPCIPNFGLPSFKLKFLS